MRCPKHTIGGQTWIGKARRTQEVDITRYIYLSGGNGREIVWSWWWVSWEMTQNFWGKLFVVMPDPLCSTAIIWCRIFSHSNTIIASTEQRGKTHRSVDLCMYLDKNCLKLMLGQLGDDWPAKAKMSRYNVVILEPAASTAVKAEVEGTRRF